VRHGFGCGKFGGHSPELLAHRRDREKWVVSFISPTREFVMKPLHVTVAALAIAAAMPAEAATITRDYVFTGSNIQTTFGNAVSPVSTVNLTFRVTFDPLVEQLNAPTGAMLTGANIPLGSAFRHSFIPNNMDRMSVGGAANGTFGVGVSNDDFTLDFRNALSDTPQFTVFFFSTAATSGSVFRAFSGQISSVAVPEPASWAMIIAGFGILGAAMRYRHRKASVRLA
jgi:hypothetical protein